VLIGFPDAASQRVFNDYDLLQSRFGPRIAQRIANRMAMLKAAKHLGMVDNRPPIRLHKVTGRWNEFTVDLLGSQTLRFAARIRSGGQTPPLRDLRFVDEIEILGVE
jgi:hypothetical protein